MSLTLLYNFLVLLTASSYLIPLLGKPKTVSIKHSYIFNTIKYWALLEIIFYLIKIPFAFYFYTKTPINNIFAIVEFLLSIFILLKILDRKRVFFYVIASIDLIIASINLLETKSLFIPLDHLYLFQSVGLILLSLIAMQRILWSDRLKSKSLELTIVIAIFIYEIMTSTFFCHLIEIFSSKNKKLHLLTLLTLLLANSARSTFFSIIILKKWKTN